MARAFLTRLFNEIQDLARKERELKEINEKGRRAAHHARWRHRILQRDGHICRACGSPSDLELAHVTSVESFVRAFADVEAAVLASYREDNLVTLCRACHRWAGLWDNPVRAERAAREAKVRRLFAAMMRERGWHRPEGARPDLARSKFRFREEYLRVPVNAFLRGARYGSNARLMAFLGPMEEPRGRKSRRERDRSMSLEDFF